MLEKDGSDFWNTARIAECKGVVLPVSATSAPFCLFQQHLIPASSEALERQTVEGLAQVRTSHAPQLTKAILVNRSQTDEPINYQHSFMDRLRATDEPRELTPCKPEDIVVLFATSGSTGFCKLVPRTHKEILDAARSFEGGKDGRYFSDRPFGWMGGFPFDFLAYCSVRVLQVSRPEITVSFKIGVSFWQIFNSFYRMTHAKVKKKIHLLKSVVLFFFLFFSISALFQQPPVYMYEGRYLKFVLEACCI